MAVQLGTFPPAKVRVTCCGVVINVPFVPQVSELGNAAMLTADGTVPACVTITVCPAILKDPIRLCEPLFAVTDQFTVLPETTTEAQVTFEVAVAALQVDELGVTVIAPDEAAAVRFNVLALTM